ncbi:potassium-transporting ATPase subunit C [Streptomyces parvus]|uniref:potassium-transporting ATPase subunit C n=1 Tax=Streptomyces parvus TaxID=66428 RepID=UPI0037187D89
MLLRRSDDLIATIEDRKAQIAEREGVSPSTIPADAVTASASGLDPHISVAYALLQVPRVASARALSEAEVRDAVESRIQGRDLGFLGEERINVAELNLALYDLEG